MERFNLDTWLEDKSRKVIDDDGFPVEIIKWDANEKCPVVCLNHNGMAYNVSVDGMYDADPNHGIFFADKELTEFEKELQTIISEASHWTSDDGSISTYCQFGDKEIKKISVQILDLAKRELQPEFDKEIDKAYKNIDTIVYDNGYKQGQYEIMEDLPKWKKAEKDEELDCHVAIQQDDRVVLSDFVQKDEYYITLDVLKKLPKEE